MNLITNFAGGGGGTGRQFWRCSRSPRSSPPLLSASLQLAPRRLTTLSSSSASIATPTTSFSPIRHSRSAPN